MGNFKATSTSTVEARLFVYGNQVASGSATASSSSTGDIISEVRENASELSTTLAQNLASGTVPSISSATIEFKTDTSTTVTNTTTNFYPWTNGNVPINAFLMWQGNFVGSSPVTQYYFTSISEPQISYQTASNLVAGNGTFTYNDQVPTNVGINCVILFSGYSNAQSALNNLTNYTNGNNMYTVATNYLNSLPSGTPKLIGLSLGGGVASTGGWNTGNSGAIYSIYQAVTNKGVFFSYTETGTGNTLSGTGTGNLYNQWNCLFFDIETWSGSSGTGSTGQDFINLFNYIKTNSNSTFKSSDSECIIIVSGSHSCSNYNGTGQTVFSTLYSDSTGSYDYISPQMYTENIGSTNEYCANYNILWNDNYSGANNSFQYYLSQNATYQKYGVNMILPCINLPNLYQSGGTNPTGGNPNLYWFQSNSSSTNPAEALASGYITIPYNQDNGIGPFFNSIMNNTSQTTGTIGGYVQWINGTLSTN